MTKFIVAFTIFLSGCTSFLEFGNAEKVDRKKLEEIFEQESCCLDDTGLTLDEGSLVSSLTKASALLEEGFSLEDLLGTEMSNGYHFLHFLFSVKDEKIFNEIFSKCFQDKRIPKEVLENRTQIEKFNILHLSIFSDNLDAATLVLERAEDCKLLDTGDANGNTPFFSLCSRYIDSLVRDVPSEWTGKAEGLFITMLRSNFEMNHLNSGGRNFLGDTMDNLFLYPYEDEIKTSRAKVAILDLISFLQNLKWHVATDKSEGLEKMLEDCVQNLEAEIDQEFKSAVLAATSGRTKEIKREKPRDLEESVLVVAEEKVPLPVHGPRGGSEKKEVEKGSSIADSLTSGMAGASALIDSPFTSEFQSIAVHSEFVPSAILVKGAREEASAAQEARTETRAASPAPSYRTFRSSGSRKGIFEDYELIGAGEDAGEELVNKVLADRNLKKLVRLHFQLRSSKKGGESASGLFGVAGAIISGEIESELAKLVTVENAEVKTLLHRLVLIMFLGEGVRKIYLDPQMMKISRWQEALNEVREWVVNWQTSAKFSATQVLPHLERHGYYLPWKMQERLEELREEVLDKHRYPWQMEIQIRLEGRKPKGTAEEIAKQRMIEEKRMIEESLELLEMELRREDRLNGKCRKEMGLLRGIKGEIEKDFENSLRGGEFERILFKKMADYIKLEVIGKALPHKSLPTAAIKPDGIAHLAMELFYAVPDSMGKKEVFIDLFMSRLFLEFTDSLASGEDVDALVEKAMRTLIEIEQLMALSRDIIEEAAPSSDACESNAKIAVPAQALTLPKSQQDGNQLTVL